MKADGVIHGSTCQSVPEQNTGAAASTGMLSSIYDWKLNNTLIIFIIISSLKKTNITSSNWRNATEENERKHWQLTKYQISAMKRRKEEVKEKRLKTNFYFIHDKFTTV